MELIMATQEDATPWSLPPPSNSTSSFPFQSTPTLHGRGYFAELGVVRRKPSRPDAPLTLSKSCSDKLALKQCTSLLSSITSLLISPENCYIHSLVLPKSQYSSTACARAFSPSGRMSGMKGRAWDNGYAFKPFHFLTTEKEFPFSRRAPVRTGEKLVPSNISTAWTPNSCENLIGGVLQGRKQFDAKGASWVCNRRMWSLAIEVAELVAVPAVKRALGMESYGDMKGSEGLEIRREVKGDVRGHSLKGWVSSGGEEFEVRGVEI